ncbi:MAG TPA: LptE family protein [Candidatus Polarisedimenticolia bacterium]|nr:LptE family protein [Candidatus Polarisedimenticolia bacterium]
MNRPARAAAAGVALWAAAGAACGYRLAGRNQLLPPEVRVIAVPPFENKTRRPEIEQRITEQITATFIQRGGYRTTAAEAGSDAVLQGEVTGYDVTPVSVGPDGRANRYEVVITAAVELRAVPGSEVLFRSSHFVFKKQYDVEGTSADLFDQEIVAIEEIARDFAQSVVTSILEGF